MGKNNPVQVVIDSLIFAQFVPDFQNALKNSPRLTLEQFHKEFCEKCKINHNHDHCAISTPSVVLGLLYLLILYPQQKSRLIKGNNLISSLSEYGINPRLDLWPKNELPNMEKLIRHIRNSIAHARISIDDFKNFIFEDCKPNEPVDTRIVFSFNDLAMFLTKLLDYFQYKNQDDLWINIYEYKVVYGVVIVAYSSFIIHHSSFRL